MTLKEITEIFISEEIDYSKLTQATQELNKIFSQASGFDRNKEANREDIHIAEGKAIGATWAAACIDEILRTKLFIKGIYEAINDLLKQKDSVHILYAGSGPFATLLTPLTTLFSSEQLKFTLLEINPISIQHLNALIDHMDLHAYVDDIIECNAASIQLDKAEHFDIFLTETMLKALSKEPQVAITLNILPQLKEDVVLIPENIIIEAGIKNWEKESQYLFGQGQVKDKGRIMLQTIFELNKSSAKTFISNEQADSKAYTFPIVKVQLPEHIEEGYSQLFLGTSITTYGNNLLSENDSSLTLPYDILNDINGIHEIQFQYKIDEDPKFEFEVLS